LYGSRSRPSLANYDLDLSLDFSLDLVLGGQISKLFNWFQIFLKWFIRSSIRGTSSAILIIKPHLDLQIGKNLELSLGGQISKLFNLFLIFLRWFIRSGIRGTYSVIFIIDLNWTSKLASNFDFSLGGQYFKRQDILGGRSGEGSLEGGSKKIFHGPVADYEPYVLVFLWFLFTKQKSVIYIKSKIMIRKYFFKLFWIFFFMGAVGGQKIFVLSLIQVSHFF